MNESERFFIRQDPDNTYLIITCRICNEERAYNYDSDDEWNMYSLVEFMEAHRHPDMMSPTVKQEPLPLGMVLLAEAAESLVDATCKFPSVADPL